LGCLEAGVSENAATFPVASAFAVTVAPALPLLLLLFLAHDEFAALFDMHEFAALAL